jgi:hypothetical protein
MSARLNRHVDKAMLWAAGAGMPQENITSSRHRDKHVRFAAACSETVRETKRLM